MSAENDIYDAELVPAPPTEPRPVPFKQCLRTLCYGTEELFRLQLLLQTPAVSLRALAHWLLIGDGTLTFTLVLALEVPVYTLLFPVRIMVQTVPRGLPDWPLLETRAATRAFWKTPANFAGLCAFYYGPAAASTALLLLAGITVAHANSKPAEFFLLGAAPLALATVAITLMAAWFHEMNLDAKFALARERAARTQREKDLLRGPNPLHRQADLQTHLTRGASPSTRTM